MDLGQFGKRDDRVIGPVPGRHRLAVEPHLLVQRAAWLKDAGKLFSTAAAKAKLFATDMAMSVTTDAVQLLGGSGYTQDFPVERYMREAVKVSNDSPVLLDHFLSAAVEVDIDAVSDGHQVVIGGIMQHVEQAGVHSGDSACALPPYSLPADVQDEMRAQVKKMAVELGVKEIGRAHV